MLRAGCLEAEMWRMSEVVRLDGQGPRSALNIGGSLEAEISKDWVDAVRGLADTYTEAVGGLGRWREDAMHSWQVAAWAGDKRVELGLVRGKPESGSMKMLRLIRTEGAETTQVRRTLRGRGTVKGTVAAVIWRHDLDDDSEMTRVPTEDLWPVEWMRTEGPSRIGDREIGRTVCYVLDDIPEGLAQDLMHAQREGGDNTHRHEWMRKEGFRPGTEADRAGMREQTMAASESRPNWDKRTIQALLGEGKMGMAGSFRYEEAYLSCEEDGLAPESWPGLDMFSDGGADKAGTDQAT
jgi:hypothetical protein